MRHVLLLIVLALFLSAPSPGETASVSSENRVKAAYLYNFAKFILWPDMAFADNNSPLVIGVVGKNPFNDELSPLAQRKIRNRPIEIHQFKSVRDIDHCHLLFVGPSVSKGLRKILNTLSVRPIITVSDEKNFVAYGGVIQFVTKRDRLRFIVNLDVAKTNSIKINSQLLALAAEVLESGK
jgi:YfiR/HmsC-like